LAVYYNVNPIAIDGLILHVDVANPKSYPGSGATLTDLSNIGNTGTLQNGVSYSANNLGSLVFDGENQSVTFNTQLDPIAYGLFATSTSVWSVSAWFLPDYTKTSSSAIVSKAGGIGTAATFVVWDDGSELRVRLRGGDVVDITTSLTEIWNEVVITWDGSVAKAYLNSVYSTNISVGTAAKQTNNFCIGAAANGVNSFYKGSIANVKVYNIALSPAQIEQNYNSLRHRYGV